MYVQTVYMFLYFRGVYISCVLNYRKVLRGGTLCSKLKLKWFSKVLCETLEVSFLILNQVHYYFEGYYIICLCETWLTDGHTEKMIDIPGYGHIRLDRSSGNIMSNNNQPKRGGSLVIHYRKELSAYITMLYCSKISPHLEQLWVWIKRPDHGKQIISVTLDPHQEIVKYSFMNSTLPWII